MPAPLGWTIADRDGPVIVAVRGELGLAGTAPLHRALLKCLAEQPDALLVDLSRMSVAEPAALSIFATVVRQAARWPGTPVVLCEPRPDTEAWLRRSRVPILATVSAGLLLVEKGLVMAPSLTDQLLPLAGAARHARNMVTQACTMWDLPDLVGPGSLIVDELVGNAAEHAGTMMTLQIGCRPHYLHLAVRDGSPEPPLLRPPPLLAAAVRGRGLLLVDSVASHWGWLPSRDGKVVWAMLSIGDRFPMGDV